MLSPRPEDSVLSWMFAAALAAPSPLIAIGDTLVTEDGGYVEITNLSSRDHVALVGSRSIGSACPGVLQGACLTVNAPILLGGGTTDATGTARVSIDLPAVRGVEVYLQAVVLQGSAPALYSARRRVEVVQTEDSDADGLVDLDERRRGSDPRDSDTDGDGVQDGQEVLLGTDPLLAMSVLVQETLCGDGVDNDGDGGADCDDLDCACGELFCDDGVDDDGDGLVDCEDAACAGDPACLETLCDDGVDNDGDGVADCDDEDCWSVACHDTVLSWVVSGNSFVSAAPTAPPGAFVIDGLRQYVGGRVYVDGPAAPARVCDWTATRMWSTSSYDNELEVWVDPNCRLGDDFLPDPATLTLTQSGLRSSQGLRYPHAGTAYYAPYVGATVVAYSELLGPSTPRGTCPSGAPVLGYVDADGDGFGVSAVRDLWNQPSTLQYSCVPQPGLVTRGGDCDDADPAWNPVDVQLAPGRTCTDASPFDRDADGIPAFLDPDDRDGSVP
jgi:hypothetical protein